MFVRKSTYNAAIAQRDTATNRVVTLSAENAGLKSSNRSLRMTADTRGEKLRRAEQENERLRADLAATYVRNAKGQIVRHPSAAK